MIVTWYVDDGYVGSKTRPHKVEVDDSDLEDCDNDYERDQLIEDCVRDAFEQTISYYWDEN